MSTKISSRDVRHLLRVAAPPGLTIGVLLVIGELSFLDAWTSTFATTRRVATALAVLWFFVSTGTAGYRTRRNASANQRLQQLRAAAQAPGRALVEVLTVGWSSGAGQHVVVVNIATGHRYRLWLPEVPLPIGAFVVVEQRDHGVAVIDWAAQCTVDAAHRHERRYPTRGSSVHVRASVDYPEDEDDARRLIEETEQFLRQQ